MNDILKQRLTGALILVALGVVFWPIIFIEEGAKPLDKLAHIPVRPNIETTPIEPPSKKGLRVSPDIQANAQMELAAVPGHDAGPQALEEAGKTRAPVLTVDNPGPSKVRTTRTEPPVKPTLDADGIPIGWILQVASISDPGKADELRKRLLEMGYKAYVKKIKTENSVLLRVYVGPKFERARLESIQAAIDTEFKVHSMVRRYIP